ncbi:histidine phosphatase family protein [Mucilaginibacter pallidiroseus]|uniref:Histidine phosphatase family protein n=1 Tax=Mucilaginibacter pallidiroseus TaxID=2599295 RepID=A0A563U144_9SPHI|nr:histidine phosphatase family protein [Mucilaginibacter pallidiroseus]TWR25120.1 histidine phosphatase family protein [Mucilaginibacter pallidiroseus]
MKNLFVILLLFATANIAIAQSKAAPGDLRVIIIRHAEKPAEGDNLSCRGLNRAMALPAVITKRFGVPDYVYVPSPSTGKATKSVRMLQTISPMAIKFNLPVNTKYDVDDTTGLVNNLTKKTGTALLVWEHDAIEKIATKLGVSGKPKWPGNDYDSIWIITIHNGKAALVKTKEGIKVGDSCAF